MSIILQIGLLFGAFLATVVGVFEKSWNKEKMAREPISRLGWSVIAVASAVLIIGSVKSYVDFRDLEQQRTKTISQQIALEEASRRYGALRAATNNAFAGVESFWSNWAANFRLDIPIVENVHVQIVSAEQRQILERRVVEAVRYSLSVHNEEMEKIRKSYMESTANEFR